MDFGRSSDVIHIIAASLFALVFRSLVKLSLALPRRPLDGVEVASRWQKNCQLKSLLFQRTHGAIRKRTTKIAYGFGYSLFLGLARPNLGLLNADNYAVLALCLQYLTLTCLGFHEVSIAKRDEVSFRPAPRSREMIREDAGFGWNEVFRGE